MRLPAYSGLFASFIAAAAPPPDDIPTCKKESKKLCKRDKLLTGLKQHAVPSNGVFKMPTVH